MNLQECFESCSAVSFSGLRGKDIGTTLLFQEDTSISSCK